MNAPTMTSYCTACGHQITGSAFCTKCGTPSRPVVYTASPTAAHASGPAAKPAHKPVLIATASVLAVGVIAAASIFYVGQNNASLTNAAQPAPTATSTPQPAPTVTVTPRPAPTVTVTAPPVVTRTTSNLIGTWSGPLNQPGHGASYGQDYVEPVRYQGTLRITEVSGSYVAGYYNDYQTTGSHSNPQSFQVEGTIANGTLDLRGVEGTQDLPPGDAFFMNHFILHTNGTTLTGKFYKPNGTYLGTANFTRS